MSFSCNVSHADTFHPHLMMCTNMTTILSHQEDLGPSMLDVKYEGLGGTGLVTTPLNMAPNLSECNVSHGGIALKQSPVITSSLYWSWVDVRQYTPLCSSVIHFVPRQSLLSNTILHTIQPSPPMYFHSHRPSHTILLSSHHMALIPLPAPFLDLRFPPLSLSP